MWVAWDDNDFCWSARDEDVRYDGRAGYPEWEQPDGVVAELRAELARIDRFLDSLVDAA